MHVATVYLITENMQFPLAEFCNELPMLLVETSVLQTKIDIW